MTALDRAFIKAFAETGSRPAARENRGEATIDAPPAAAIGGTAQPVDSPRISARGKRRPAEAIAETTLPPPLSAFAAPPKTPAPFRAALEVDHLTWPEACDRLHSRASRALNDFAEQLAERIGRGQKCMALASCRRGEGRTTACLVVARHLAALGLRSVIVDADFENPRLAASCGIFDHAGWADVLQAELPLGEALVAAVEDGVTLMPWHGSTVGSTTLASSPGIAAGFAMLRERYDLTLLDTMPLANEASIGELAALAASIRLDGLYLIHDTRRSADDELARACGQLRAAGVRVEGIIENFVAPEGAGPLAGQEESKPVAGPQLAAYG